MIQTSVMPQCGPLGTSIYKGAAGTFLILRKICCIVYFSILMLRDQEYFQLQSHLLLVNHSIWVTGAQVSARLTALLSGVSLYRVSCPRIPCMEKKDKSNHQLSIIHVSVTGSSFCGIHIDSRVVNNLKCMWDS